MTLAQILVVVAGAFSGGFISGLAGFGTGLVAVGIWLHAVPPGMAATLSAICSVISQLQTLPSIWHAIRPRLVLPYILPGLAGVPVGTLLGGLVAPNVFRVCVGLLLIGFSSFSLVWGSRRRITWGGRGADALIGLGGGVLGGMSGLSGPLPTMWASVRGYGKDERRSLFQAFNLSILLTTVIAHAANGRVNAALGLAVATALPGTMLGSWLGAAAYRRLSDRHFNTLILYLLALSGASLLWASR